MGNWVLVLIFLSSPVGGGSSYPVTMTQIFGYTSQDECVFAGKDWENPPTKQGERNQYTYRFRCLEIK